jgi:cell division protein FtsL
MADEALDTRLSVHEAVCAERYRNIENAFKDNKDYTRESFDKGAKRMTRIEYLLYATIACVLLGPGVAAGVIHRLFGI